MRGGLWQLVGYGSSIVLRFGSSLVLTRLLAKDVFGIVAVVSSVMIGLTLFSDIGTYQSIVQNPRGRDRDFRDTAWTLGAVRGLGLALIAMLIAPLVAHAYPNFPGLGVFIQVAALGLAIDGLSSTGYYVARRDLAIRRLAIFDAVTSLMAAAVTIFLAWHWHSPWPIVLGTLAGSVIRSLGTHLVFGWDRRFALDPATVRVIVSFGVWIFATTVLTFLTQHADRLLLALFLQPPEVGVYNVALNIAMIGPAIALSLNGGVAWPALVAAFNRGENIAPLFRKLRRPLFVLNGWVLAGFVGGGEPATALLYRSEWSDAGWIIQWLGAALWIGTALDSPRVNALFATGHGRLMALSMLVKFLGLCTFVPIGYHAAGFPGILAGYLAAEILKYTTSLVMSFSYGVRDFVDDIAFTLVFAVACAAAWSSHRFVASLGCNVVVQCLTVFVAVSLVWLPLAMRMLRRKNRPAPPANAGSAATARPGCDR